MTPGYILADKYRLITLLGRGGMGAVWCAERLEWGSLVAVKLMERASEARPDILARFLQEARLAANLRSSHVVQVLDDGRDASTGTPFIVMELLVGETLAQRLARVQRLTPAETARVVTHVARALALAHELGMVHRDLKPDNIFLVRNDDEETAKVLDFGIAKWNQESWLADAATTTGTAIGTPAYMSPEQIKDSKRVDHGTDLWSLAVIATECLTGRRAFEADNLLSLALSICTELPPAPSSLGVVPAGVDAWFERATARQVSRRFGSARELAEEFRRACGLDPVTRDASLAESALPPRASIVHERTELLGAPALGRQMPVPQSTEGLTRTEGAVAAFRTGPRRLRVLALVAALLALVALGLTVRSELGPQVPLRQRVDGIIHGAQLALRPTSGATETDRAVALEAVPSLPAVDGAAATPLPARVDAPARSEPARAEVLSGEPPPRAAPAHEPAQPASLHAAAAPVLGVALESRGPAAAVPAAAVVSAPAVVLEASPVEGSIPPSADAPVAAPPAPAASVADGPAASAASAAAPAVATQAAVDPNLAAPAPDVPAPGEASAADVDETSVRAFDPSAARVALQAAADQAQSCRPPAGPHGRGRVQVRFEPSGKVGAAWMMTPLFDNTVTGACVLMLFRRATVPEFDGAPEMVIKSFEVP